MTGKTHDLAAFTALNFVIATTILPPMSFGTAIIAFSANMIGGLAPDIDQPTAALWNRMRGGSIIGRLMQPLFGGHRYISHSLIGLFLFGYALKIILGILHSILLVDMDLVWWSFMIGFLSHLIMDTITHDGVPWLFPIPIKFGIPPFRFLRIKTGGVVEKNFIFPMLLITNIYFFYAYYNNFLMFFRSIVK